MNIDNIEIENKQPEQVEKLEKEFTNNKGTKIIINTKEVDEDAELLLKFKWNNLLFFIPFIGIWIWSFKYFWLNKNLKSSFIAREFHNINVKWHLILILNIFISFFINLYPFIYRFIIRTKILIVAIYVTNNK